MIDHDVLREMLQSAAHIEQVTHTLFYDQQMHRTSLTEVRLQGILTSTKKIKAQLEAVLGPQARRLPQR